MHSPSVAVLLAELLKASVSLAVLLLSRRQHSSPPAPPAPAPAPAPAARGKTSETSWLRAQARECARLSVPSALYTVQNTLLYTALAHLDAPTFQVTSQLKILSTAACARVVLGTRLGARKWAALAVLSLGVVVIQLDQPAGGELQQEAARGKQDRTTGLLAILLASLSSGLAGCYFEYVLKSANTSKEGQPPPPASLWARNLQLSVPSLLFALVGVTLSSPSSSSRDVGPGGGVGTGGASTTTTTSTTIESLLEGFDTLALAAVSNHALGGLLVAVVVRETDSVAKGFATSLAIVRESPLTRPLGLCCSVENGGLMAVRATIQCRRPRRQSCSARRHPPCSSWAPHWSSSQRRSMLAREPPLLCFFAVRDNALLSNVCARGGCGLLRRVDSTIKPRHASMVSSNCVRVASRGSSHIATRAHAATRDTDSAQVARRPRSTPANSAAARAVLLVLTAWR